MKRVVTLSLILLLAVGAYSQKSKNAADRSGFVVVSEVVPDVILEIRYYSTYNFVGTRIDGYKEPVALMTREAAAALKKVSDYVKSKGYRLKIYDAYRPQCAVSHFCRWAKDADTSMKRFFYPNLEKDRLFKEDYIATKSGHSRGSTVDLTLFDMKTGKEVDMGGTFDMLDPSAHPDYVGNLTKEQIANRMMLREAMLKFGFKPLYSEWWHFTLRNEPYPTTYFTFPVTFK
ncbi:MAG: M15 family metallopeptidase [Bacteroidales bacterium]|nr:M15 family metallopeptidase [Bacteroidales bacterium]